MQFTANQIASFVNGNVQGDGEVLINTFAKIEEAKPGALTFLSNPKYTHFIYTTQASAVLVANDFVPEHTLNATLIKVPDAYRALALLMQAVDKAVNTHPTGIEQPSFVAENAQIGKDVYIGAFAYVGDNALVGNKVKIYPQTYIGRHVKIGDGTIIYPGVKIYHGCQIGNNCILHSGVVIGADGFGFAPDTDGHYNKIPQLGVVHICDNVEIGANATIDRATMGATTIGRGTKLDNMVQIAHNVVVGEDTVMAAQAGVAGSSKIGNRCMMGGQVGVAGHIVIGDNVQVGAQTGIPKDVPSGSKIMGYPAVDVRQFMKQSACIKRLPELFAQLAAKKDS